MSPVSNPFTKNSHVLRLENGMLQFNKQAIEITILDRRGQPMWKMTRSVDQPAILWDGVDMYGSVADAGAYTCKIVYGDRQIIYVPFVFMM